MADVDVWIPHGSTFGPLLFLTYINSLAGDLLNAKQHETLLFINFTNFTDTYLLFSVVYYVKSSADEVNNDLVKFNEWTYQVKMSFNPDPIKYTQDVIFTRKISKEDHAPLFF